MNTWTGDFYMFNSGDRMYSKKIDGYLYASPYVLVADLYNGRAPELTSAGFPLAAVLKKPGSSSEDTLKSLAESIFPSVPPIKLTVC